MSVVSFVDVNFEGDIVDGQILYKCRFSTRFRDLHVIINVTNRDDVKDGFKECDIPLFLENISKREKSEIKSDRVYLYCYPPGGNKDEYTLRIGSMDGSFCMNFEEESVMEEIIKVLSLPSKIRKTLEPYIEGKSKANFYYESVYDYDYAMYIDNYNEYDDEGELVSNEIDPEEVILTEDVFEGIRSEIFEATSNKHFE